MHHFIPFYIQALPENVYHRIFLTCVVTVIVAAQLFVYALAVAFAVKLVL